MKKNLFTLCFLTGCLAMHAQWSDNPEVNNLITPLNAGTYNFEMAVSNNGTVYVNYLRPINGNIASVLQIVDPAGNMLFPPEGKIISHKETLSWTLVGQLLFVDREGNLLIAVTDCRNATDGYSISYSLYKVSATGELLWGEAGLDLANGQAFDLVHNMNMLQLEDGSYVCVWAWSDETTTHIQMQRVSQSGEFLWGQEGISLFDNTVNCEYPRLVNAGNNQVIVLFTKGGARYLMARKIDFDGSLVWAEDVIIYRGGFTIPPLQGILRIISDQMGGAFVGWYDDRNSTNKESTYVAHVTAAGKLGFASGEGGERVGYNEFLRGFAPDMYFDKEASELYVAWRETSSGQSWQQMTGQKLKIPSGELMWDPDGKEIAPLTEDHSISFYSIQGAGNGNVAVFYSWNTWHPEYFYQWDINSVLLINSKGEHVWENEIIQFANAVGKKGDLESSPLIKNSYWITAWSDERKIEEDPDGNRKIYLQRINLDGTLGNNGSSIKMNTLTSSFAVYPTVVDGDAHFYVNMEKASKADISLYSIMGQKMETVFSGILPNGDHVITWNPQKSMLSKGIYIATLTLDTGKKSIRIIVN
ncbi:MAG: T9SS type A sorting domain-containing protein [Lentimicrobiaceae bacterium]|nr:T9SS type A sorting domain-containing protein [Lentimicrobiaceae bacterium]